MLESFLKKNLNLKLLSLVLSTLLWFTVHLTQSTIPIGKSSENLKIPLTIENISPGLHVLDAPSDVFIEVKSSRKELDSIKPSDFKAFIDATGKRAGAFRDLPVTVASPGNYVVTKVNPPTAQLIIDEEGEKTVPVTWQFSDDKEPGQVMVEPPEIVVKGPKSQVDRIVAAQIALNSDLPSEDSGKEFTPILIDSLSRPAPGPSMIPQTVKVIIKRRSHLEPLVIRPLIIGKMHKGVELESIQVNPASVLLEPASGKEPPDHLDTLPIDITGKEQSFMEKTKLVIPSGMKVEGDKEVTVIIELKKAELMIRP